MSIISRVLLFIGGSVAISTGILLVALPSIISEGEVTVTVAKLIFVDLFLAVIIGLIIGGLVAIGYAIGGGC